MTVISNVDGEEGKEEGEGKLGCIKAFHVQAINTVTTQ